MQEKDEVSTGLKLLRILEDLYQLYNNNNNIFYIDVDPDKIL